MSIPDLNKKRTRHCLVYTAKDLPGAFFFLDGSRCTERNDGSWMLPTGFVNSFSCTTVTVCQEYFPSGGWGGTHYVRAPYHPITYSWSSNDLSNAIWEFVEHQSSCLIKSTDETKTTAFAVHDSPWKDLGNG